jgi:hypothetical protein
LWGIGTILFLRRAPLETPYSLTKCLYIHCFILLTLPPAFAVAASWNLKKANISLIQDVLYCQGYYCSHLGKPSGQPSDTPRMVTGHVPEARARSI